MLGAFKTKDAHILDTLDEVREVSDEWIHDYSHHRPHDVFNNLMRVDFHAVSEASLVVVLSRS